MRKKINKVQILRFISQIVFLILLPGLFTLAFSQLKTVYLMLMKNQFDFIKALPNYNYTDNYTVWKIFLWMDVRIWNI